MRLNNILKVTITLLAILAIPMIAECKEISLPDGWRFPTKADFTGEWEENSKYSTKPFLVEADFDGNGKNDSAWILIKNDGSWGFFVVLNLNSESSDLIQLDVTKKGSKRYLPPQSMGLRLVPRGKYKTACGKGYYDCENGEPEEIEFKLPAIKYFRFESASSIFYWDVKVSSFKRIWMSD